VCVCVCVCVYTDTDTHTDTDTDTDTHTHTTHTHTHTHSLTQPSTPCGESAAATAAVPGILVILRDAAAAASLSIRAIVELPAAAV
jgi:carbohydrate-binding DOMON domain-containing protein